MKQVSIQTNFTAGEISPRLYAHTDLAKYKNGIKTATNTEVLPHGPVRRRSGFKYIAEVKDSTKATRIIRFQFDQVDAYILEFGHNYIRFYKDGGQVESGGSPYTLTSTYTEDEIFDITYTQFGRILYLFHGNHPPATLIWTSETSWALSDVNFRPAPSDESGQSPAGITVTPSATTGSGINFTTSAAYWLAGDVGRQIVNLTDLGIASITSVSSSTVAVGTVIENFPNTSAIAAGNWKVDLSPITNLTPSGYKEGSQINMTTAANAWRAADGTNRYVTVYNGVVRILSYTSATVAVGVVEKSLTDVKATETWSFENPVWTSELGYPKVGGLHQARLFSANNTTNPQTIWASEIGIYDSMGVGDEDTAALNIDISMKDISQISWMMNLRGQLAIGTTGGEITLDAGSSAGAITPSSIVQQVRGYNGSNLQQPIGLNDEVIYIGKSSTKINAFRYDFQIDNYISEDLLFLAEHMAESGIKELAYAQDPDKHLYAILNNGEMLVCTYVREQNVLGWSRYITDGEFESVSTISTETHDEVWVVINRTINGSTKRYIERLDQSPGTDYIDGFSDSYLVYSNPKTISGITKASPGVVTAVAHGFSDGDSVKLIEVSGMTEVVGRTFKVTNKTTDTFELYDVDDNKVDTSSYTTYSSGGEAHKLVTNISGLSHLEGKTVQIKADGAVHTNKIVSGGAVVLDRKAYELTIGLPYTTTITTLAKEFTQPGSSISSQGQKMRWVRPILRIYRSCLPSLDGEVLPARSAQDLMDNALNLYTGDLIYGDLTWKDGFSTSLNIETSLPLPFMLLGIFGTIDAGFE